MWHECSRHHGCILDQWHYVCTTQKLHCVTMNNIVGIKQVLQVHCYAFHLYPMRQTQKPFYLNNLHKKAFWCNCFTVVVSVTENFFRGRLQSFPPVFCLPFVSSRSEYRMFGSEVLVLAGTRRNLYAWYGSCTITSPRCNYTHGEILFLKMCGAASGSLPATLFKAIFRPRNFIVTFSFCPLENTARPNRKRRAPTRLNWNALNTSPGGSTRRLTLAFHKLQLRSNPPPSTTNTGYTKMCHLGHYHFIQGQTHHRLQRKKFLLKFCHQHLLCSAQ